MILKFASVQTAFKNT